MQNNSPTVSLLLRRIAAFLYDCLLLIALFFIITAIAIGFNDGEAIRHPLLNVFLFLCAFIFFDGFWRHGGQTLGMRAWRLRVEGINGEKLTFKQSFLRYLVGSLLFGFTYIAALFSPTKQTLHDRLSKTKIIRYYK